jgi:formate dehydrogenase subunit gamma
MSATGQLERYTFGERLMHWTTGLTYLYCLATGLAFYTPYLYWLAIALGGGPTSRYWHPIIGVVFFLGTLWMNSMWRRDMAITADDKRWLDNTSAYVTNDEERTPLSGRFNGGQKLFYWLMLWGAVLLLLTGIVMWIPEYIPRQYSWIRGIVILLHEIGALATIGGFIIHVYMGVFMVPRSMTAITTGYVTRSWAWTHHRLWYLRVTGRNG